MDKNTLMKKADVMIEMMGRADFVDDLMRALDKKDLQDALEYIDQCRELHLFD